MYYLVNFYCFVGKLIAKYELVLITKNCFGRMKSSKDHQESRLETELLRNSIWIKNSLQVLQPGSGTSAEKEKETPNGAHLIYSPNVEVPPGGGGPSSWSKMLKIILHSEIIVRQNVFENSYLWKQS